MLKFLPTTTAIVSLFFVSVIYADMEVQPTQLYIAKNRSASVTFKLTDETETKIYNVTALKWSQNEKGEDVLTPDPVVMINPKNFSIKPEKSQTVRVGFSQPVQAMNLKQEGSWRIIFTEIPPVKEQETVKFLLNFSLPLFVGKQQKADLSANINYKSNKLILSLKNNASSHVQIKEIKLMDSNGKMIATNSNSKYLLAYQKNEFNLGDVKVINPKGYKLLITIDNQNEPLEISL